MTYLQLASAFVVAIGAIVDKLGLPVGEPMGRPCSGYDLEPAALTGP